MLVIIISYLPLLIIGLSVEALFTMVLYSDGEGFGELSSDPAWSEALLAMMEGPAFFIVVFGLLGYPFVTWGLTIWWRSQEGRIRVRTSLKSIWTVGLVYLIPTLVTSVGLLPLFWADPFDGETVTEPQRNELILTIIPTFIAYWFSFRLASALVGASLGTYRGFVTEWRATSADNKLCLFLALDLSFVAMIIDAVAQVFQGISDARWERALESDETAFVAPPLWFDSIVTSVDVVAISWLILVELALVWAIAQRYVRTSS